MICGVIRPGTYFGVCWGGQQTQALQLATVDCRQPWSPLRHCLLAVLGPAHYPTRLSPKMQRIQTLCGFLVGMECRPLLKRRVGSTICGSGALQVVAI